MVPSLFLGAEPGWNLKPPVAGAIYVKIDRKRKIAVTTLLKALGMNEAQMREVFKHVDQGTH